jgi:hypothetical protein
MSELVFQQFVFTAGRRPSPVYRYRRGIILPAPAVDDWDRYTWAWKHPVGTHWTWREERKTHLESMENMKRKFETWVDYLEDNYEARDDQVGAHDE